MLLLLGELTIKSLIWTSKSVYYLGHWLVYGREETEAEKLEKLSRKIERLENEIKEINHPINETLDEEYIVLETL